MIQLTTPQRERLEAMLESAFNKGDLIRLTSFSMNKSWDSIVSPGPLLDQIHELVAYAEKKGLRPLAGI